MDELCEACPNERVHRVEYRLLRERVDELKARMAHVETTLTRGLMLLVANLAGVIVTLIREFLQR